MRVSDKGLIEIAGHEGIVPAPYKDSVGVWTFGVGHTHNAGGLDPREMNSAMPEGEAFSEAVDRALLLFKDDVKKYERRVNDAIKVPLDQHEFDALVSFDINTGGIYRARLTKDINSGNKSGSGFMGWLKPPEIKGRRTKEMELFQTGKYSNFNEGVGVWKTDGRGNLRGVVEVVSGDELLSRMNPTPAPSAPVGFWAFIMGLLK